MKQLLYAFLWILLCAGIAFAQNNSALTPQALPGLNLQIRGGTILLGTSSIGVSTQSITLTNNATNYVFLTTAGAIQSNTTGFTGTVLQIATVVTSQGQIVSIQDNRPDFIFNGSGLPAGCTSGTNPLILCTQAANGNDTINESRFTDSSPTGTFLNFMNAAKNATLFSLDVLGNTTALSYQTNGTGAGYFQCSNGNGTLPTLVVGQAMFGCPVGAITNYYMAVPTAAGTGPLCGTNVSNVVSLAFGGCSIQIMSAQATTSTVWTGTSYCGFSICSGNFTQPFGQTAAARALSVSHLSAYAANPPTGNATITVTFQMCTPSGTPASCTGINQTVTCQITATVNPCTDTTHTDSPALNAFMDWTVVGVVGTGTLPSTQLNLSWEVQ